MTLYKALTDRLGTQHETIGHIIVSLNREQLFQRPAPEKWSIHDNIAHLVVIQPVFVKRIKVILREDEPVFGNYTAENDTAFEEWRSRDTDDLLAALYNDRQVLFDLVTTLDDKNLQRTGTHEKYGRLSVLQWAEFFLLHEAHHLLTIFRLANSGG